MTSTRNIQPALDHLEAALEASCATLINLECSRVRARDLASDERRLQEQISSAITSLREAISELRAMHDAQASMLAFGFVMRTTANRPVRADRHGQFIPRRTA